MAERSEHERERAAANSERQLDVLRATLAATPEIRLLNSIWAARQLQSGNSDAGLNILREVPPDAVTTDIANPASIYPWELELIANERLAAPFPALFQEVTPENWGQLAAFTNLVRSIENNQSAVFHNPDNVIDYLFLIGGRQFDWQQGFLSKQEIFRSVYIYGQGKCAEHFESKYGVSIDTFTSVCFAYFATFNSHPQAHDDMDLSILGIDDRQRQAVLSIVTAQLRDAKQSARSLRDPDGELAFQPSVLRTHPMIGISARSHRLLCPLPDLLMFRMTFGLFYDVIDGSGPIRDEIGHQFEKYVELNLNEFLPQIIVEREFAYWTKLGQVKSPDLILSRGTSTIDALLECKASRLPLTTRYALFDIKQRGYQEMIKGVKQIWRFVSDARRGLIDRNVANDAVGAVLTLDSWFVAAPNRQEAVLEEAKRQCDTSRSNVRECDMIPISFVYMPEFERLLAYEDSELIFSTLKTTAEKAKRGFGFDRAHDQELTEGKDVRVFPFDHLLGEVLPWWDRIASMR